MVLSTLTGFNDPDSPGASTCPAQDPVSAPAPVVLQQGQSPDHHSPGPVPHPSPSLSPGMAPSAGAAPRATPPVAPGQGDGVALIHPSIHVDGLSSPHWVVGQDFGSGGRGLSWLSSCIMWQFPDSERCEMEVLNATRCLSVCLMKCFTYRKETLLGLSLFCRTIHCISSVSVTTCFTF